MNHGCTIMTQKQSSSLCNGRCRPLRNQKKRTNFAATSSQYWSFFDFQGIVHKEFVPPGHTQWEFLLQGFETTEGKCEVQMA